MHATQVIKRPLITEKGTWEVTARNRYGFRVDRRARKSQIKAAIEELYEVHVLKVRTQIRKGKYRRTRFGPAKTSDWKNAIVELKPDAKIELF